MSDHRQLSLRLRNIRPLRFSPRCSAREPVWRWQTWLVTLCLSCLSLTTSKAQEPTVSPLASAVLVEPIKIPVVVPEPVVRQIRVTANFEDSPTTAQLEFDIAKLQFNDFGDPIRQGQPNVIKFQVNLVAVDPKNDPAKDFKFYEVQELQEDKRGVRLVVPVKFKNKDDHRHVRLVVTSGEYASNLLTLSPQDDDKGPGSLQPKMEGEHWSTDPLRIAGSLKAISIDQWNGEKARLHLDPNHQSWSADGLTVTSTLMGWQPRQVNVVDTKTADPLNMDRKLWELTLNEPRRTRYFVVEDEQGKNHRLIIKTDDKLRYVAPLRPLPRPR